MAHNIRCPHCAEMFTIDESGYAEIASQVRDAEFNRSIEERIALLHSQKDAEITAIRAQQDAKVAELTARVEALQNERDLAVNAAVAEARREQEMSHHELVRECDQLKASLQTAQVEVQRMEASHKAELAEKLRLKDEQIEDRNREIERIRDMKMRLSTKMLGETLEQHCEMAFNQIRAAAFPHAYFEKDNEVVEGTKGDYVFRDFDEDNLEIVSIMFEMKNEQDDGQKHRKNEDHFKKLDEDRRKKGCEYAVLVSTLEPTSELYNTGIVDVSYRYPKMYVIRPQFFIPIISLLRNAAERSMEYRKDLELARRQAVDVTNFEERLEKFKKDFGYNYGQASKKFNTAIEEIDKTIAHLQKVRDALTGSNRNLEIANRKAEDLTIKRLVRGNPTMAAKFKEARAANDSSAADASSMDSSGMDDSGSEHANASTSASEFDA